MLQVIGNWTVQLKITLSLMGWHCLTLMFDAFFSDCTGVDTADTDWIQVQLSLGRGGLDLLTVLLSILQLLIWHH